MLHQKKNLSVLDYGGGLASTFFRNFEIVKGLGLYWTIIEQKHIVDVANKMLGKIPNLKFISSSDLTNQKNISYDVLIFGSSLQFMENPKDLVARLYHDKLQTIVFEQIPFMKKGPTRLTVQQIKEPIYNASYPAWHFNENEFQSWINNAFVKKLRTVNPHVTNSFGDFHSNLIDLVYMRNTS